jgi:hypothetical protein
MSEIEFPPDIITPNARAWYLHEIIGMTFEEIGPLIHYSKIGAYNQIMQPFKKLPRSKIYKLKQDYCKSVCRDSAEECPTCHLFRFVAMKMMRPLQTV